MSEQQLDYLKYWGPGNDCRDVLERLMTAYGNDVWNYVFSLTRNRHQTDDIVQETFLKVYRNLHLFRGESSVKTWILRIARNAVYDHRRSAFLRKVLLVETISCEEAGPSAEQEVLRRELANDMWELVMRLPAEHREVMVLFAHHQLSLQEIADLLQVRVGTVKSRLFHARQKLNQWREGCGSDGVE